MFGIRLVAVARALALAVGVALAASIFVTPGRADDPPPTITIAGPAAVVAEGANATFTISLSGGTDATEYAVTWKTSDGTAVAGQDYTGQASTAVTLTAGAEGKASKTVTVATTNDNRYEPDQAFKAQIACADACNGAVVGAAAEATATIHSDDAPPVIDITPPDATNEGNSATTRFRFIVTLSRPSDDDVQVHAQTDPGSSAKPPADYTAVSKDIVFTGGDTSQNFDVLVNGDTTNEPDETLQVNLSNNVWIGNGAAVATIKNDDAAPPPPPLSIGDVAVVEGNSGTTSAVFTVTVAGSHPNVTFNWSTRDGSALAPGDYTPVGGGSVTIPAGAATATAHLAVPVAGDTLDENNETFDVVLDNIAGAASSDATGRATITNDDNNSAVSISDATVEEGATAILTVTLSPGSGRSVTVQYHTENGTAAAPGRYTSASGTVTIDPGKTSAQIPVATVADGASHANETFTVKIDSVGGAKPGTPATGTVTIVDKQAPPTLSIADSTGAEGTTLSFTVSLLGSAAGTPVTVAYATQNGTAFPNATAPEDFAAVSGTLTFAPGERTKTVAVKTVDDGASEADEAFLVNLTSPVGATLTRFRATGRIVDNDGGTAPPPPPTGGSTPPPAPIPGPTPSGPAVVPPTTRAGRPPIMPIAARQPVVVPKTALITIFLTCPAEVTTSCAGVLSLLTLKQDARLGLTNFNSVIPGTSKGIKLKVNAAGLKLLRKGKPVKLMVRVLATADGSSFDESTKTVTLKYTPPKKKAKAKPKTAAKTKAKAKPKPKTSITVTIPKKK